MTDTNNVYQAPSLATIVAYFCAALMLFFVTILTCLYIESKRDFELIRKEIRDLKAQDLRFAKLVRGPQDVDSRGTPATAAAPQPQPPAPVKTAPAVQAEAPARPEPKAQPKAQVQTPRPAPGRPRPVSMGKIATLRAPDPKPEPIPAEAEPVASPKTAKPPAAKKPLLAPPVETEIARPAPKPASALQGKILATNPDQLRVILSLGSTSGVQPGTRFNVYRSGRWVGDIRVARVFADMSMCEVKSTPRGIRVEDLAKAVPAGAATP